MTEMRPPLDLNKDPVLSRIIFASRDVLEVGCGSGRFTLKYLTRANSVLGIDPDESALDRLRAQWAELSASSRGDFHPGDITGYPLPREAFDIAVFSHSL